jgi:hypothetical protein
MKYFTPELYVRLQRPDASSMDAADAEWEAAESKYESHLAAIRDKLPGSALKLLDGPRLHDAEVIWMGQAGPFFAILLKLEPPIHGTMLLSYRTANKVQFDKNVFPADFRASQMQWMYDEIDLGSQAECFRHAVLFSNGCELQLEASEIQIAIVDTLYASSMPSKVPV